MHRPEAGTLSSKDAPRQRSKRFRPAASQLSFVLLLTLASLAICTTAAEIIEDLSNASKQGYLQESLAT